MISSCKDKINSFLSRSKFGFPFIVYVLAFVGLIIRIFIAIYSDYINQADEIFQYLEQSHRLVFDFGYIPWEFRYQVRSWLIPYLISPILASTKFIGVDTPNFYVPLVKIFFSIISISLVFSVYKITESFFSKRIAYLSALFITCWYELIYFSSKATPEVLSTYFILGAWGILSSSRTNLKIILAALVLSISIIIRIQYFPVVIFIIIFYFFRFNLKQKKLFILTTIVSLILGGLIDYVSWGTYYISIYNQIMFFFTIDSALFKNEPPLYYLYSILFLSSYIFVLGFLISFSNLKKTWFFILLSLFVIVPHSLISTKEHRFIFFAIPILLILSANSMVLVTSFYNIHFKRLSTIVAVIMICLVSLNGALLKLPNQIQYYQASLFSRSNFLQIYKDLFSDENVKAILNTHSDWNTVIGGYYYLHKDIPIYTNYHLKKMKTNSQFKIIDKDMYKEFFSHLICYSHSEKIPGYKHYKTIGQFELWKQINPPDKLKKLNIDTKNIFFPGIDDRIKNEIK